jgi:hypothetical protein
MEIIFPPEYNKLTDLIEKQAQNIADKKIEIIASKCKQLGIDFDINREITRPVKVFHVVRHGREETFFYNDVKNKKIRIVTFVERPPDFSNTDCNFSLSFSYSYC